eukprot:scaffold10474_cov122-Isochrysis_galbana.AAC.9
MGGDGLGGVEAGGVQEVGLQLLHVGPLQGPRRVLDRAAPERTAEAACGQGPLAPSRLNLELRRTFAAKVGRRGCGLRDTLALHPREVVGQIEEEACEDARQPSRAVEREEVHAGRAVPAGGPDVGPNAHAVEPCKECQRANRLDAALCESHDTKETGAAVIIHGEACRQLCLELGDIDCIMKEKRVGPPIVPQHIPAAQEARTVCRLLPAGVVSLTHVLRTACRA